MNHKFGLLLLGLALAAPAPLLASYDGDLAALRQLDDDVLRAFLAADVAAYQRLLAEDFQCVLADGRLIDRAEFLREAASPPGAADLRRQDPQIRLYGDVAVLVARVAYRRADGSEVQTRYTDVCIRRGGQWRIASAQFTRLASRSPAR